MRAEWLKADLGISTFDDLLQYYPFRHIDKTTFYKINQLNESQAYVQVVGKLISLKLLGEGGKRRLVGEFADETGKMELVWFQGIKWVQSGLRLNEHYVVFGKPSYFKGQFNMAHPEMELLAEARSKQNIPKLHPVYNTTEKLKQKSIDSKAIGKMIWQLLELHGQQVVENLPLEVRKKYQLIDRKVAFRQVHFPTEPAMLEAARKRLKFEELLFLQFGLLSNKKKRLAGSRGHLFLKVGDFFNGFYKNHLPFELTEAQKRVLREIRADMGSGKQMNRLLQGDVGSGKTVVALLSMLLAADNGFQACIMAPTEILATQHHQSISEMLQGTGLEVGLLTGSTKIKERRRLHEALRTGELHFLVGTHALIEPDVVFNNLGLTIIDEQHRFGVAQRAALWAKNSLAPHVLVMTATPIPRTLAMTLYGDLDVSVIDELPKGRKPIKTLHANDTQRLRVFAFMREQIALGRQVYMVYPMIEESEKSDLKYLMDGYESVARAFPRPKYQLSIVHGKMKPDDKQQEMARFASGNTNIMVATTVIEVGVNVPNASVMVVENAERFGLSQLHQLRGRVGRGAEQSYCVLMTGDKLSSDAATRIKTMCETNDGFKIAEVDLQLRGPGDLAGTQQSGTLDFAIANLTEDSELLRQSRMALEQIFEEDASSEVGMVRTLEQFYASMRHKHKNWSAIS
jgi:ATP-dependent DNA helicase RecG